MYDTSGVGDSFRKNTIVILGSWHIYKMATTCVWRLFGADFLGPLLSDVPKLQVAKQPAPRPCCKNPVDGTTGISTLQAGTRWGHCKGGQVTPWEGPPAESEGSLRVVHPEGISFRCFLHLLVGLSVHTWHILLISNMCTVRTVSSVRRCSIWLCWTAYVHAIKDLITISIVPGRLRITFLHDTFSWCIGYCSFHCDCIIGYIQFGAFTHIFLFQPITTKSYFSSSISVTHAFVELILRVLILSVKQGQYMLAKVVGMNSLLACVNDPNQ